MTSPDPAVPTKAELRRRILDARRARPVRRRLDDDRARTALVLAALRDLAPTTLSCYLSVPPHAERPEPGTIELVTALWTLGHRVLVPVLGGLDASPRPRTGARRDPAWAVFEGPAALRPGLWGIPEPTGAALPASALGEAELVLCSGLAGTARGERLGVGGGWYDRALAHLAPDAEVWMLLNDDEVLAQLPTEPHDRRVDALLLPGDVVRCCD